MILTILYDNYAYDERLQTAWGFACLLERGDLRVLFDTGGDPSMLLANVDALGVDPAGLDAIVLSHSHGDHVGGLAGVLRVNEGTTVHLPSSFPARFKDELAATAQVVEVEEPICIAPGIHTTGEMGLSILEQALVVETARGAVIITGCAHPGVVEMVARAKEVVGDPIDLVIGGFHLSGAGEAKIQNIIEDLKALGVQRVAPCHCSGDQARRMFEEAYGEAFLRVGVGARLELIP